MTSGFNFQEVIQRISYKKRMNLAGYLHRLAVRPLYIYGAGCFGRELYAVFSQHGFGVQGFLDRNARACEPADVNVLYPEACTDKANVQVVLGIVLNKKEREQLVQVLRAMGYQHISDGQEIRAHYVYAKEADGETEPQAYYARAAVQIEAAHALFADAESRQTYEKNLSAHLLRDYSDCAQTEQSIQYFLSDIPFARGWTRFIDCGAYIGDTLQQLCEQREKIDAVAAFEPNLDNFARLSRFYDAKLTNRIAEAILFPCGAAGKSELRTFAKAGGSSSIIANGEEIVQCAALDDVLKSFAPTFIKMDIEGAEYDALCGAKQMIRKYRPDLAICVYHIIDDFYRIPLLIHQWGLGYQFYLRTHSSCCMETVLYAVCPKGGA